MGFEPTTHCNSEGRTVTSLALASNQPRTRKTSSGGGPPKGRGLLKRWGLAAALNAVVPHRQGRDRLVHLVRMSKVPKPLQTGTHTQWGPRLRAIVNPVVAGSLQALYRAKWVRPALVPMLDACLRPGDLFVDLGATVGVYATWAPTIVGSPGSVLVLEPGPITTLDRLLDGRAPALIKIDVGGYELPVLEGARRTLARTHPPVVSEAPVFGAGAGTVGCVCLLDSFGYREGSRSPQPEHLMGLASSPPVVSA